MQEETKDNIIDTQKKQIEDLIARLKDPKNGLEGMDKIIEQFKDMPEMENMKKVAQDLHGFAKGLEPLLEQLKNLPPEVIAQMKKDSVK